MLTLKSAEELARELAERVRERRLSRGWTQAELAERAGVSAPTYVLFERTGRIALLRLIRVLSALGLESEFERLASAPEIAAKSLDELTAPKRQRGRRSK